MNANTGNPWSDMDMADLENGLRLGDSVEKIADFLCRDVDEVARKIAEREKARPPLSEQPG